MKEPRLKGNELDYYNTYGGYCLGMEIARQYSEDFGFLIPKQCIFENQSIEELANTFPNGFGVKRSGMDEAYSARSLRGVNSSRGLYCTSNDTLEIYST